MMMENHQTIQEIYRAVGRIEGEVKSIRENVVKQNGAVAQNVQDINDLQQRQDIADGKVKGVLIVSGIIGLLIAVLQLASYFKR